MTRRARLGEGNWERDGFLRLPGFVSGEELDTLEELCRNVIRKWAEIHADADWRDRTTNMAGLTDPRYFDDPKDLLTLLEWIAEGRILTVLEQCSGSGAKPMFHNTQFFFEQPRHTWDGDWHRDTQFDAKGDDDERRRIARYTGAHFRVALQPDPWLELIPGSHRRWDTAEEYAVRRSPDPAARSFAEMPGAVSLELDRGDALVFHAWAIHRGRYRTTPVRRTLDIIYGWPGAAPFATPQPLCFSNLDILRQLTPGARRVFERFVSAYRDRWAEASASASAQRVEEL